MASAALGIGGLVGHYRILQRLGEGGMGIVYRARDERLGRDVALKFLPPGHDDEVSRKRLHQEARVLAKLNHPNIATVYDFDFQDELAFLVEEYVTGESLATRLSFGPLREAEVLRFGAQLAEGLSCAHQAGIIHRDLKPGNLHITVDGRLKILDFGVAQLFERTGLATTQSVLDLPMAGTLAYQAPEQLRGERASIRTDIYAAGVVLYEMCTGRKPFGPLPPVQLIQKIAVEQPQLPRQLNPEISPELEGILLKCMDKDSSLRYQSALELGIDLRRLCTTGSTTDLLVPPIRKTNHKTALIASLTIVVLVAGVIGASISRIRGFLHPAPVSAIRSVAVLPLSNLSRDPAQEYFADGMTEELITDLAQISALRVISRTSVMTYKGSTKSLPQIARELNVDAVVEGSVERVKDRVRITAQLIRAQTDQHMWAKGYEGDVSDILTLQENVARAIADEVQIKLTAEELRRLNKPHAVNAEAHENYLRGRYYWNQRTNVGLQEAIGYLEKAVSQDPNYALAYSTLSDCYQLLPDLMGETARTNYPKARTAALKALELDPSLAEAHASMARLKEDYDWDWEGAEQDYQKAIELNPGLGAVHAWYANLLAETGRLSEAVVESRRALDLDPLSSFVNSNLASILYFAGDYPAALEQTFKTLEIDRGSARAHRNLGRIYLAQGSFDKAVAEYQKAVELSPGTPEYLGELGYIFGKSGESYRAEEILRQLQRSFDRGEASSYQLALVYAGMGNRERTLKLLERALDERAPGIVQLQVARWFDSFRSESRFQDILRRAGFIRATNASV